MASKLRIAQIGTTHEHAMGKFASILKLNKLYEVVGVVDDFGHTTTPALPPKDRAIIEPFPKLTLDELLANRDKVDVVAIETPNNELVPVAIQCMKVKLPMHVDKPGGESHKLFKTLVNGCRKRYIPFQMGYMFRGNPAISFCIKAIHEGWFGDIFEITADMNHNYGGDEYQNYIGSFKGGIAYNLICHLIDFVVSMLGKPSEVIPFLKNTPDLPPTVKNNCLAVLNYPNATAVLRSCDKDCDTTALRRLHISGTGGTATLQPIERFDGKSLILIVNFLKDNPEYEAGTHVIDFGVQRDRYINQFIKLYEVVSGHIPIPDCYEHDIIVHETTLKAAGYL